MARHTIHSDDKGLPSRAHLEGTTVAGGKRSRSRFSRILGVEPVRAKGFAVTSVAWVSDHVEVEVRQPDTEAVIFSIERSEQGRPFFLSQGRLSIYYQGPPLSPLLDTAIRAIAPKTLARFDLEALADLIASDPDAGRATEPIPNPPSESQRDYDEQALLATWGSPGVWTSFFAVAEVARSQLDSLDFFDRCTFVQHCDLECLCVNPQLGVPATPVVLYPWEDRIRRLDWPERWSLGRDEKKSGGPGMVTTDLDERDVILGLGPKKLADALEHLKSQPLGAMVFCSSTCVPVVAGEDMETVVNQYRSRLPVPVLYLTTTPQSMQGVFRDLLVRRRLEAENSTPEATPTRVNLIGFPDEPALDELRHLLELVGVEVNTVLLPALSPELVDQLPGAALNVLHPNELWRGHYDQLLFDSRLTAVTPPAPFGRQGTLNWIRSIVDSVGGTQEVQTILAPQIEASQSSWDSLRAEAQDHCLTFVLRDQDIRHLTDPAQTWGIPLLEVTAEMGFRRLVLLHRSRESTTVKAQEALSQRQESPKQLEIRFFDDRQELQQLLDEADISAVYSEHFYDRRVTESGHSTFSGQHFERGIAGAHRSLVRLLETCRLPFYRRYGRHLRRAANRRILPNAFGVSSRPADKIQEVGNG